MRRALIIGAVAGVVVLVGLLFFFGGSPVTGASPASYKIPADAKISSEYIHTTLKSPSRNITINATTSDVPSSVPIYWGTIREDEVVSKMMGDITNTKHNVTSVKNAPDVAKKVMESFGGLPSDAVITLVETEYLYSQSMTGEILYQEPILTVVHYDRMVDGLMVGGHDADYIGLSFGENDELISIGKHWRNLTFLKKTSLIPASKVMENLIENETLAFDQQLPDNHLTEIHIYNISLKYYETGDRDTYLEPVWIFWGVIEYSDNPRLNPGITFIVNARHFADFTVKNQSVSVSQPISFTDSSQTKANKWFWDFGDGSTSTLQNPLYSYRKPGNYSVNFTVWNIFGSDSVTKPVRVVP